MRKALVRRINSNPAYSKVFEWGKLIAVTGSSQAIIQAIGLLSGIFVIRMLPTHEYALYTLANTMLGTMAVLSDSGISTGVMAQGGKVWNNRKKLGTVLTTGFELRKLFSYGSLLFAIPVLFYLLSRHNSNLVSSILIIVAIIPAFLSSLSASLLQVGLTLNQDIRPLQSNQIWVSVFRFLLLLIGLFITPWAFVAILASGIPQFWANFRLRNLVIKHADLKQKSDLNIRKEILNSVKRLFPVAVYFCLSGQITIWLMSIFGTTTSLAELGALGRLSMVLNVVGAMFGLLIVPRFSRMPSNKTLLFSRFVFIQVGLLLLSAFIITIVWVFPKEVLWILGKDYSNLQREVVLSVIAACLGLMAGGAAALSTSRAWIINPVISISIAVVTLLCGIWLLNVSSIIGMLKLNILLMSIEFLMFFIYTLIKISKT